MSEDVLALPQWSYDFLRAEAMRDQLRTGRLNGQPDLMAERIATRAAQEMLKFSRRRPRSDRRYVGEE